MGAMKYRRLKVLERATGVTNNSSSNNYSSRTFVYTHFKQWFDLSELIVKKNVRTWHNVIFKLLNLHIYVVLKETEVNKGIKICLSLMTIFRCSKNA